MGTNRLLDWLPASKGWDGAFTHMAKGTSATVSRVETVAHVPGQFVVDIITERWFGTDKDLATKAGMSVSKLSQLKTGGATPKTRTFRLLCNALGVDAQKAFQGQKVFTADAGQNRRPDLHALLNRLIGTSDEATVERVMRGLLKPD